MADKAIESGKKSTERYEMSKFKDKAKDFAAMGFNKLPDSANLFLRYISGLGTRNLDLDDSTISAFRESAKSKESGLDYRNIENPSKIQTTLGRFRSEINPTSNLDPSINIFDRYDMINEMEDPSLVSGKIEPFKAIGELLGVGYGKSAYKTGGPKGIPTRFARAALYALPIKPEGFDIDIDIPFSGDINNREIYNK